MVFTYIFEVVAGIILGFVVMSVFDSYVGFIIAGGIIVFTILLHVLNEWFEYHPHLFFGFLGVASLTCAIVGLCVDSILVMLICLLAAGLFRGIFFMTDADTSWYDSYFFELDEKIYQIWDEDRNAFINILGVLVAMFLNALPVLIIIFVNAPDLYTHTFYWWMYILYFFPVALYTYKTVRCAMEA